MGRPGRVRGGPAFVRSLRLDGRPRSRSRSWACRLVGALAGLGLVLLVGRLSNRGRRGQIVWLAALGGASGTPSPTRSSGRSASWSGWPTCREVRRPSTSRWGSTSGRWSVHLLWAVIGALIAVGLGYDVGEGAKPAGRTAALAVSLFAAALFAGAVVLLSRMFQNDQLGLRDKLEGAGPGWNVLAWTFMLFFVPMLCLGTISPQVIRLSIPDTGHAGRVAGTVYAWSTAGAIVGTFATGYFLIDLLGMARVLFLVSLVLLALTFVVGRLWRNTPAVVRRQHRVRDRGGRHVRRSGSATADTPSSRSTTRSRCRPVYERRADGEQVMPVQDARPRSPDPLVRRPGRPELPRVPARGSAGRVGPVRPRPRGRPTSW